MTEKVEKPRRRRGKKGKEVQKNLKTFTSTSNSTNTIDLKLDSNRFKFREHQSLLLILDEDAQYWYDIGQNIKDRNATIYNSSEMKESSSSSHSKMNKPKLVPAEIASSYRSLADKIYQHEINLYNVQYSSTSDDKWVENTMRKGTLKDRVAAMSVTASQTPVHKMRAGLDQLLHLATQAKTSSQQQRVNQLAGEALVDLFTETYLPSDRKLYSLSSRPLMKYYNNNNETLSPRVLLLWYFEELIKEKYSSFLNLLTKWCSTENGGGSTSSGSNLIYMNNMTGSSSELQKIMAIKTAAHLLSQRPEGEERLLSMIVNKIGDPHKKTAAASGHALRNVLDQHPVMIHVIAREVMQLAHRPHLSSKALYNCIVFLNQLKLKNSSEKYTTLASDLVQTYFQLFEVAVNQHQQDDNSSKKKLNVKNDTPGIVMNSRLLSALLTGVNRAHPFLPPSESLQDKKRIDALYRIAHMTSSPGTATQALTLLYHLAIGVNEDDDESNQQDKVKKDLDTKVSSSSRKDRFYRVLYSSLSSHTMVCRGGTKHHLTLFFNLLYKSMKRDVIPLRVLAFGKRLLHTVMHAIENSCGVKSASIFLLSEVARYQPILKNFHLTTMDNCEFNPAKRDPCVAFGDKEKKCHHLWEIQMISQHFHPSVRKFAQNFMDNDRGNVIDYGGDPLRDFSLTSFLDRVAYRHPKTRQKKDVDEGIEDEQASSHIGIRKKNMVVSTAVPVNDEKFWNGLGKKVSVENEFFQKYFVERARRDKAKGIERNSDVKLDPEMDLDKLILENEKKEDDIHKKVNYIHCIVIILVYLKVTNNEINFVIIGSWMKMDGKQIQRKRHLQMNLQKS